jgi:excisionase family DNA binding protein
MVKRDGEAPDRPDWMSSQEAASHLGITVRTLYRLIDDGKLTAYRMGRVIRLQRPDVLTYLESSRIQPGELTHLYPEPADPDG